MRGKLALTSLIILTSLSFTSCQMSNSDFSFQKYKQRINMKTYDIDGKEDTCNLMAITSSKEIKQEENI